MATSMEIVPSGELQKQFGFTVEKVMEAARDQVRRTRK